MKPTFYTKIPLVYNIILGILFFITIFVTLGLTWIFWYDFFMCHKYWLNRRILMKYLNQKDLKFTKKPIFKDITEYQFESFEIWVWNKQLQITVSNTDNSDYVGLFVESIFADRKTIQIIRQLNKLD